MIIVNPQKEILTLTHNNIEYTKSFFKTGTITNVTAETISLYDANTTYSLDDEVIIDELKTVYKSASDNNTDYPLNSSKWTEIRSINSHAMFNEKEIGSKTTGENLNITIDFSMLNSLVLFGAKFETLNIKHLTANDELLKEIDVIGKDISCSSLYEFCTQEPKETNKVVLTDFFNYVGSRLELSFIGRCEIETFIVGNAKELGLTLTDGTFSFSDESEYQKNAFTGYLSTHSKMIVKQMSTDILIKQKDFNQVAKSVDEVLGSYIVVIAVNSETFIESSLFARITSFEKRVNNDEYIECSMNIEGITKCK